jgi:rhodanese-related sulfurtransferase
VKLVADAETQRVLGVQAMGPRDMPRTIDTVATALTAGMTLHGLANLDVGYAPPYASALSTLAHAANALRNKLAGLSNTTGPAELKNKLESGGDFVLFDIRKPAEIEKSKIDDRRLLTIPMHELQERAKEIPEGKDIVVVCQIGSRSYEAARTVSGLGFENVTWLEGGLSSWQKFFQGE